MARIMVQLERKRRETPWLLLISALLFLVTLVFNCLTWGGLARVEPTGARIEYTAGVSAPLAWTYLKLGKGVGGLLGIPQLQVEAVTQAYATALPAIDAEPEKAVDLVLSARESMRATLLGYSHYACPILLLIWILSTFFRAGRLNTYNARR